jgi:hypothetical protein
MGSRRLGLLFASFISASLASACSSPRDETPDESDAGRATATGGAAAAGGAGVPDGAAVPGDSGPAGVGGGGGGGGAAGAGGANAGGAGGSGGGAGGNGGDPSGAGGGGGGGGTAPVDAPVDGSVGLGAPSTCPAGAVICDGFEGAAINAARWSTFTDPGIALVSLDGTVKARGASSVHLTGVAGQKGEVGFGTNVDVPNPAYLRFYIRTASNTAQPGGGGLVTMDDGGTPQHDVNFGWEGTTIDIEGNVLTGAPTHDGGLPHERWTCVVMKASSGVPGEFSVALDGAAAPVLTTTFVAPTQLHRLLFSMNFDLRLSAQPYDAWIDEVALSDRPLACID